MPKTKLGKVSLSPKGAWDAAAAYEQLDMVSYDGGSWLAKKPSTNITPADGEYWLKVAEKGDTGSDADVTKENIVKALGFEPEKPEGEYELIEEITLTEDTAQVTITDSLVGHSHINIFVHSPSTAKWKTVQCDAWDSSGKKYYWYLTGLLNTNGISVVDTNFANGVITMILFSGISGNQAVDGGNCRFCRRITDGRHLTKANLYISSTDLFPSGTTFKVYALREE